MVRAELATPSPNRLGNVRAPTSVVKVRFATAKAAGPRTESAMAREPILDNPLEQYLREVNAYRLLTRDEELALARRYQQTGDPDAARALVTANLRFVVKVAYQFSNYDIKVTDLIQEGNIGLMKAVQKFKPDRGFRLISYAVWWIKAYIQNYIINTWSLVRVGPVAQQRKVLFGRRELPAPGGEAAGPEVLEGEVEDGGEGESEGEGEATFLLAAESASAPARRKARKPTAEEVEEWRRAALAARRDLDLDGAVSEDGRLTLGETIADDEPGADERLASAELSAMVAERLAELHSELSDKELVILEQRLLGDETVTLQEVGERFGISRERVRQIEANLKKKIAKRLEGLAPIGLLEAPRPQGATASL